MLGKIEKKVVDIIRAKLEFHTRFDRASLNLTTSAMFDGYEVHTTTVCLDDLAEEILIIVEKRLGIAGLIPPDLASSATAINTCTKTLK